MTRVMKPRLIEKFVRIQCVDDYLASESKIVEKSLKESLTLLS